MKVYALLLRVIAALTPDSERIQKYLNKSSADIYLSKTVIITCVYNTWQYKNKWLY